VLRRAHDAEGAGGTRIVLGASLCSTHDRAEGVAGHRPLRQVVEMNPMSAEACGDLGNTLER
jgi:hypothetical protein